MDRRVKFPIIVLMVAAIILAAGALYVYFNDSGSYDAKASLDSDTVEYTLNGPSSEYCYSVISGTDLPDKIYFYLDMVYDSNFNDYYVQSEYFSVMEQMLERRNYTSVEYVNAQQLVKVMNEPDSAVIFISGALPDTVYSGEADSPFKKWMDLGGTVYWSGPEIGRYVSTKTGITDLGSGFFGGDVNTDQKDPYAYNESEMFRYTHTRYDDSLYGLRADRANSLPLAYVSDSGYSSVSAAKLFGGNAIIFGGNIATTETVYEVLMDRTYVADLLICGLTYESKGIYAGSGTVHGKASASFDVTSESDMVFFIAAGEPASHWAKAIQLN